MIERDDALFGGLVAFFSAIAAFALSHAWTPPSLPQPLPPRNLSVHFAAAPAAAPSGTTERQAVEAPRLVPVKPKPKPHPLPKAPTRPAPPAEHDSDAGADTPTIIESTATLAVPSVLVPKAPQPSAATVPDMPEIPTAIATAGPPTTPPPMPDDADEPVNPFQLKPYGDTVVVAFKINSDGVILDSRILVPSWNALGDMSIRLAAESKAAKSIRYTNINPPLQPGEVRWIVIPHSWESAAGGSSLP